MPPTSKRGARQITLYKFVPDGGLMSSNRDFASLAASGAPCGVGFSRNSAAAIADRTNLSGPRYSRARFMMQA